MFPQYWQILLESSFYSRSWMFFPNIDIRDLATCTFISSQTHDEKNKNLSLLVLCTEIWITDKLKPKVLPKELSWLSQHDIIMPSIKTTPLQLNYLCRKYVQGSKVSFQGVSSGFVKVGCKDNLLRITDLTYSPFSLLRNGSGGQDCLCI